MHVCAVPLRPSKGLAELAEHFFGHQRATIAPERAGLNPTDTVAGLKPMVISSAEASRFNRAGVGGRLPQLTAPEMTGPNGT